MHTIKLKISDKVFDKFLWLLSKFSKDEIEVVMSNQDLKATKKYLQGELDEINSGNATFISQDELQNRLDSII